MKIFQIATALLALFFLTTETAKAEALEQPDVTVFKAKKIITMDEDIDEAYYVGISGDRITHLFDTEEQVAEFAKHRNVMVDESFADKIIMPGLIDPHLHPMLGAVLLPTVFITPEDWTKPDGFYPGVRTPEGYRARLKKALAENKDKVFMSWGHQSQFHDELHRKELDQLAGGQPVVIIQRSFHEFILNTAALKLIGLDSKAKFDAAIRAAKANPDDASFEHGVFSETANPAILNGLQPYLLSPQKLGEGFATMKAMMLANGVTTISDMATGIFSTFDVEAGLIKSQFDNPDNPSRVMLMQYAHNAKDDPDKWFLEASGKFVSDKILLKKRIKLLADGAFFAQYMQMNPPGYLDGHEGKWMTAPDELRKQAETFWAAGWSLHIHVNGDKGLDLVLDIASALPKKPGQEIVLEHLGFSTEVQNKRIAELGIMVSAQPNYVHVLADAYSSKGLGPNRAQYMVRLGSLERKNVPLGLHSDLTMAPVDPLYLAWTAATRLTMDGRVAGASERISLDKALRAITIDAARMVGLENEVGSIKIGKKADFTVLDRNPYDIGAAKLRDVKVQGVVFEGRWFPAK